MLCAGFLILRKMVVESGKRVFISLAFLVLINFFRVALQKVTRVLHKDMNFVISFVTVYSYYSIITIFIDATQLQNTIEHDANKDQESAADEILSAMFLTLYVPLLTLTIAMFHQSFLWFRFRCWVKKLYEPTIMACCGMSWLLPKAGIGCCHPSKGNNLLSWPIFKDYDFNGRGSSTAHPEYRRTKVQYDLCKMIGLITGYTYTAIMTPALQLGLNRNLFEAGSGNHRSSMAFAATGLSCLLLLVAFCSCLLYRKYLERFYEPMVIIMDEFISTFYRHPAMIGNTALIIVSTATLCTKMWLVIEFGWAGRNSFDCPSSCFKNLFGFGVQ